MILKLRQSFSFIDMKSSTITNLDTGRRLGEAVNVTGTTKNGISGGETEVLTLPHLSSFSSYPYGDETTKMLEIGG